MSVLATAPMNGFTGAAGVWCDSSVLRDFRLRRPFGEVEPLGERPSVVAGCRGAIAPWLG